MHKKEIINFFNFLFISFETKYKINSEEFLKKVLNYFYLILVLFFFFLIIIKIILILIFDFKIEPNYLNINNLNYLYFIFLNIIFKLIISFFFFHISFYISLFVLDYFKEFKKISLLLKISLFLSSLNIYFYYLNLNNVEIFNNFFNIIKIFNKI